jgi:PAS domain S-box-containing protein
MREDNQQQETALATANEQLKNSEERYHKMISEVEEYAIILLDENGIIQNWNRGAHKIKGYHDHEIVGRHFSVFYLPEDAAMDLPGQLLKKAAAEGKAIHEGWRLRKDGSRFWGSITLTALHGANGEIIGFSKVTRDLTERKMAEDQLKNFAAELQEKNEALRASEERYHRMIAEVQDYAIILLDVQGNIQNWNAGAEKIKGYTAEEIVGQNFQIFYAPEDRRVNLPQQLLAQAAETGKAIHEGWRLTKQGTKFWGSIVITAVHNEQGTLIGFSKVTRDLTDKKLTEDKLKEYLRKLEKQNEELDRFAYAASHDLQEPLRKIQTFTDLAEQYLGDEMMARKYLDKINTASARMSALVRSILEFSTLATSESHEKTDTDLNEILNTVLSDYELLIQQKKAVVRAGPLPVICAVPLQVNQLFANLVGNALKYTPRDPRISISYSFVYSRDIPHIVDMVEGNYHCLVFTDNGIGFEPQYAQLIFTLFQRLHGKHEYSGTGIGLALCKKIMDNHEGYIYAEGSPGKGASFYVYFPAV